MPIIKYIAVLLGMFVFLPNSNCQITSKESLQKVAQSAMHKSDGIKALTSLFDDYVVTKNDLEKYEKIWATYDIEDIETQLSFLYQFQKYYCAFGMENKCITTNNQLQELANRNNSPDYSFKAFMTLSRYYHDKGELLASHQLMKKASTILEIGKNLKNRNAFYVEKARQKRIAGEIDSALYFSELSLENLNLEEDFSELANSYNGKGRIFRHLGNTDSLEANYRKALFFAEKHQSTELLPSIYNNLGNVGHIKGRYDEAIEFYMKSIAFKEKKGDIKGLSIGFHNIGAIKADMLDYEGAIVELKKSNELANQLEYKVMNVHNGLKLGNAYKFSNKLDLAIDYYTEALEMAEEIDFSKGITSARLGLGLCYTEMGEYSQAQQNLYSALSQAEEIGYKSEECSALVGIAEWYLKTEESGNEKNIQFSKTEIERLLLRAKSLSEEMKYGEKRLQVYESLDRLYRNTNNLKKHNALLTEYLVYKDSIFTETRTKAIADWETKYATAEKEKEIIQLQADNKISELKARGWKIALGITAFFLSLLGFFLHKYQKRKNAQKQMEEAERFRSKLSSDLHDDVGTMLSSLSMQTDVMGLTASDEQVQKFEKLSNLSREAMSRMRDTVWAIDSRKDKVEDLLDRMKDYLADTLEGHKLKATFNHNNFELDSKLLPDVRQNIYLIFKEAVNNAAKYSSGDQLTIDFKQSNNSIYLRIHDNGVVNPSKVKTSGTGLSNMKMRANRMNLECKINTENGYEIVVQ